MIPLSTNEIPNRRRGDRAVVLGLLSATAQTLLLGLTLVAGIEGGRWNWSLSLLLIVAGLAVIFELTVRGRRLVALVPVLSTALVVALLVLGPSPFGNV